MNKPVTSIKPTIGRKVWFYDGHQAMGNIHDPSQAFDATVVFVDEDYVAGTCSVNLLVADHTGQTFTRTKVPLRDPAGGQGDSHGSGVDYATWMPYQVGQAKQRTDVGTTGDAA
jgi:hypothetical protein